MNQKNYFTQLRQEFKNNPYRDRFLQEIQDHVQDLEPDLTKKKSLTFDFMKKQFGDPKQVKKTFTQITQPWKTFEEKLGVLAYSLLMIIWTFILPILVLSLMPPLNGNQFSSIFDSIFFEIVIVFLLLYFPFSWVWKKLLEKEKVFLSQKKVIGWVFWPIITTFLLSSWELYQRWRVLGYLQHPDYYPTLILMLIAVGGISLWMYFRKKKGKKINLPRLPKKGFKILFFVYMLAYSAIRLISPSLIFSIDYGMMPDQLWMIVFSPLFYIERGMYSLPSIFTHSNVGKHYIHIVLILSLLVFSLIYLYKSRKFSWSFLAVIVYTLAFFPVSEVRWGNINLIFSVEAKEISRAIEEKQYGPFYNMVQHLEYRHRKGLGYQLETVGKKGFTLRQMTPLGDSGDFIHGVNLFNGATFEFDSLSGSIDRVEGSDKGMVNPSFDANEWIESGLSCKAPDGKEFQVSPESFSYPICISLSFKGELLVEEGWGFGFLIYDFTLSQDMNSLLITIYSEIGSQRVYWLDLTQINSDSNE